MSISLALALLSSTPTESLDKIECNGPQVSITLCEDKRFQRADDTMKKQYRKILDAAEKRDAEIIRQFGRRVLEKNNATEALRSAQTAFLIYRKKACGFVHTYYEPGTVAGEAQAACLTKITNAWTRQMTDVLGSN